MIKLADTDLAEALATLARVAARAALDIVVELETAERTNDVADVCELTAQLLRERAQKLMVVEGTDPTTPGPPERPVEQHPAIGPTPRPRFSVSGP